MRLIHDYYFDGDGQFYLKEAAGNYIYDQKYHCWKKLGPPQDLSTVNPPPSEYFYDLNAQVFKKKGSEHIVMDHNLMWEVIPSSDSNFRCPDDYFFHETDGRFYPKDAEQAKAEKYVYDQTLGAWRHRDLKRGNAKDLNPRNFYWDAMSRSFKLKVASRDKEDYFWDGNSKIYRHILSSGRSRSGYTPADFTWNNEYRAFIPMATFRKGKAQITDDLPKWDPIRKYDKGWVSETDDTKESGRSSPKGSVSRPGSKKNQVAPMSNNEKLKQDKKPKWRK